MMNGSKLLLIGVLVGFGGGMAAAIGIKVMRGRGAGTAVEASPTPGETVTPMLGSAATPSPALADASGDMSTDEVAGTSSGADEVAGTSSGGTSSGDKVAGTLAETVGGATRSGTGKGKTSGSTRVAAIPRSAPDASNELPVEEPPAKLVFAKPAAEGTALSRITEVRAGDNSTVRMELTGRARWKILELPKRSEVWIDFEEVEVPGGEKAASGSKIHVDSIRAKTFDSGAIARVVIKLAHEGKFSVSVSDGFAETVSTRGKGRTGEADGMLEVSFMGAVGGDIAGDAWATQ